MADLPPLGLEPPQPPKSAGGLFARKPKEEPVGPSQGFADMAAEVNNTARRLRILEDRYGNTRDKMQFIEQNQISSHKSLQAELRATEKDLLEIKRLLHDVDAKVGLLAQEIAAGARKEDVMVLKRYIELWQPLNFVTRNQVEKIIAEIIEEKLQTKG
ncbi:MAG: hypothetical protein AABX52_00900 [Nanoarchaeota archaeon]